jgi:hypothetical protein
VFLGFGALSSLGVSPSEPREVAMAAALLITGAVDITIALVLRPNSAAAQ